jgi:tetratricopeptide (TPR) repeat protein
MDPNDASIVTAIGLNLYCLNKKDKAEQCYRKAIEMNPNYPNAYCYLGKIEE